MFNHSLGSRTLSDEQTTIRRHFIAFFEHELYAGKYAARIHNMMRCSKNRLLVDLGDLHDFQSEDGPGFLGRGIVCEPAKFLPLAELVVWELVHRYQPDYLKFDYRSRAVHVGIAGPVGEIITPRDILAHQLNQLVAVDGIVTRLSPLRPRLVETVHYCEATNQFTRKEYRDQLSPLLDGSHLPTVNVVPKTDRDGNSLRTELGLSLFVDSQCLILQETPESAPMGQLPRHVEVRLDDDLVDTVKPGDRISVVGIFVAYTADERKCKSWKTLILCNHFQQLNILVKVPRLMESHVRWLEAFRDDQIAAHGPVGVLQTLARSIAPSICGLQKEKEALLLMMTGGVQRTAHNSRIRGDINVLLVGEPSTAKSQLLRFVMSTVPLALNTTGKGSSGVGLTAAVIADAYTGERSLSAGAMVLADRGILCIDESDKMSAQDRVSMHEAMEQQTVTIAKAGIHASLNARCSVLAAANPVYGFYSVKHSVGFNVGLPDSLLTRFDLTFIVLDKHSAQHNRRIGAHILRNHISAVPAPMSVMSVMRTVVNDQTAAVGPGTNNSRADTARQAHDVADEASIAAAVLSFRAANTSNGSAGVSTQMRTGRNPSETSTDVNFLRRYIFHAKTFEPKLTPDAQEKVTANYVELRMEQSTNGTWTRSARDGLFVTARTLESIIRLATASAKLRFSNFVESCDVDVAIGLLRASVHAPSEAAAERAADDAAGSDPHANDPLEFATGNSRRFNISPIPQHLSEARMNRMMIGAPSAASETELRVVGAKAPRPLDEDARRFGSIYSNDARPTLLHPITEYEEHHAAEEESKFHHKDAASSSDATMAPGSGSVVRHTPAQAQRVLKILRMFQGEQRTDVALHELAERVAAGGDGEGAIDIDIIALQSVVNSLSGSEFVYESTDAEDVIYFQ